MVKGKRFVEVEKKRTNVFAGFPRTPRFKCKVINLEASGSDIIGSVSGKNFQVQDGAIVDLHPSQIESLQHAVVETMKYEENTATGVITQIPIERPRFMVTIMDMKPVEVGEPDAGTDKSIVASVLADDESVKGKDSGKLVKPKLISGRK